MNNTAIDAGEYISAFLVCNSLNIEMEELVVLVEKMNTKDPNLNIRLKQNDSEIVKIHTSDIQDFLEAFYQEN